MVILFSCRDLLLRLLDLLLLLTLLPIIFICYSVRFQFSQMCGFLQLLRLFNKLLLNRVQTTYVARQGVEAKRFIDFDFVNIVIPAKRLPEGLIINSLRVEEASVIAQAFVCSPDLFRHSKAKRHV